MVAAFAAVRTKTRKRVVGRGTACTAVRGRIVVRISVIGVSVIRIIVILLLLILLVHGVLTRLLVPEKIPVIYALVVADDEKQNSLYGKEYARDRKQHVTAACIRLEEAD